MKIINTENTPKAIGPYSQAVCINNMLFVSGQIPINPKTGNIESDNIEEQTNQVFNNLEAILNEAGFGLNDVVRADVFLDDLNDFQKVNEIYGKYFGGHKPARQTVQVKIPKNALIEISIIAVKNID